MRRKPKVIYTSQLREHIARLVTEANASLTKKEIDRINNAFKESGVYEIAVGVNKKLQDMEQIAYEAKIDPRSYWTSIDHRTTIQPSYKDDVIRKKASDYIDSVNWNPSGTIPSPRDIVSAYYQFTHYVPRSERFGEYIIGGVLDIKDLLDKHNIPYDNETISRLIVKPQDFSYRFIKSAGKKKKGWFSFGRK